MNDINDDIDGDAIEQAAINTTVPQLFEELATLYVKRTGAYGDNHMRLGGVLASMFPDGITLKGPADFTRFAHFTLALLKGCRYAKNFHNGGHPDSIEDMTVYSAMVAVIDENVRKTPF